MKLKDIRCALKDLTPQQSEALSNVRSRYMVLIGLYQREDEGLSELCVQLDVEKYGHLIKGTKALPTFDVTDFVQIAKAEVGVDDDTCFAWEELAFYNEYGMTTDELDKKNKREAEQKTMLEGEQAFELHKSNGGPVQCPYPTDSNPYDLWYTGYGYAELKDQGAFDVHPDDESLSSNP